MGPYDQSPAGASLSLRELSNKRVSDISSNGASVYHQQADPEFEKVTIMTTPYGRQARLKLNSTIRKYSSVKKSTSEVKTPGRDYDIPKMQANVTIQPREDIREKGPLSQEYAIRFKKHHNLLTIPKKPVKMEWYEEDALARGLYEIMMAETDLEIMKRQLGMESDFNVSDCFKMFDLQMTGEITRRQFEEVFNLLKLYPTSLEIELTMYRYDKQFNGKLTFDDFSDVILPFDKNYRDIVLSRPSFCSSQNYARLQFFLDTTTQKMKRCLQLVVQTEMRCERVR